MKTRWGSCDTVNNKALFNLQLAKKPDNCIEYVVLHELTHLLERNHTARFKTLLSTYLPNWKDIKKELNEVKNLINRLESLEFTNLGDLFVGNPNILNLVKEINIKKEQNELTMMLNHDN